MKNVAIRLVIFFVAVCVTLLVLKGVVRLLHAHTTLVSVPVQEPASFLQQNHELKYVPAPNFGPFPFRVEHIEYELVSNEFGCFEKPYNGEDPYVLLVGDSFSHHLASLEEKWGSQLEKELGTRVLQCGVSAYSTTQELGFAKRIVSEIGKPPRLIVVGYFLNDFAEEMRNRPASALKEAESPNILSIANAATDDTQKDTLPTLGGTNRFIQTTRWLHEHSFLYRLFRIPLKSTLLNIPYLGDQLLDMGVLQKQATSFDQMLLYEQVAENAALQESWQAHVESMRAFKQFANEQGAELLFVIIPWKFQVYDFFLASEFPDAAERARVIAEPSRLLQEALGQEGIHSLDLLPLFRQLANLEPRKYLSGQEDLFFRFDLHWSPNGQLLAGLLTAEYIKNKALLETQEANAP